MKRCKENICSVLSTRNHPSVFKSDIIWGFLSCMCCVQCVISYSVTCPDRTQTINLNACNMNNKADAPVFIYLILNISDGLVLWVLSCQAQFYRSVSAYHRIVLRSCCDRCRINSFDPNPDIFQNTSDIITDHHCDLSIVAHW